VAMWQAWRKPWESLCFSILCETRHGRLSFRG
jgi:hypothetical protein